MLIRFVGGLRWLIYRPVYHICSAVWQNLGPLDVAMVVLTILLLYVIHTGLRVSATTWADQAEIDNREDFPSTGSPLEFFDTDDALDITWYHGANSQQQMQEALDGDYDMLEGDIILRWYGFPNQTTEPVMAHPPEYNSDNTLDNWLNSILARPDKAPKLDFKGEDVIEPSLQVLQNKSSMVNHPIWANADVVRGPGTISQPIDPNNFLSLVNQYYPNMTLSLGWTTGCCNQMFTREMMEDMWAIVENIPQPCSFPARAALFKGSWEHFKWLLEKDPQRFSITVWTPAGDLLWEGATPYDLLYCRNDAHKGLIYYDLPGPRFAAFRRLCITAGTPLNHFDLPSRDGILISWAHAVNSKDELAQELNGTQMMMEADVLLEGQGTENQTNTPIMAHPPDIYSDLTLEQWVQDVIKTTRGMKLDFKSTEVLEPSMQILAGHLGSYQQPVWINADLFQGPNSGSTGVNETEFKRVVLQYFPECTLSIGWTTGNGPDGYTAEMVAEMLDYVSEFEQPITFPIRASLAGKSWDNLSALLDASRSHTITIWSGNDLVDPDELVYIRESSDIDRVFYDLPDWLMALFLDRLNDTSPTWDDVNGANTSMTFNVLWCVSLFWLLMFLFDMLSSTETL